MRNQCPTTVRSDCPSWVKFMEREIDGGADADEFVVDESEVHEAIVHAYNSGLDAEVLLSSMKADRMRRSAISDRAGVGRHRQVKVILVDDDDLFREMIKANLEATGRYSLLTVGDSGETMGAIESYQPDVVLLDVVMPGTPGPELARQIRDSIRWSALPLIMLTGLMSAVGRTGVANEAVLYLAKTVSPRNLGYCIDQCVA